MVPPSSRNTTASTTNHAMLLPFRRCVSASSVQDQHHTSMCRTPSPIFDTAAPVAPGATGGPVYAAPFPSSCFPPAFLPFLLSGCSNDQHRRTNPRTTYTHTTTAANIIHHTPIDFQSLLDFWRQPTHVSYTFHPCTVRYSYGLSLDRALHGDWPFARALLLSGAFIEQCQRCGGLDQVVKSVLDHNDRRDQNKLFGIYFGALEASFSQRGMVKFLVERIDKKELIVVMSRHHCGTQTVKPSLDSDSRKRKATASTPDESTDKDGPALVMVAIQFQDVSGKKGGNEHVFHVPPKYEIRSMLSEYAKARKVNLRSLRFTLPIHLSGSDKMTKEDAELLTVGGLGVGGRVTIVCTSTYGHNMDKECSAEAAPPATASAATSVPRQTASSSAPTTPDRPGQTFVADSYAGSSRKKVKYADDVADVPATTTANNEPTLRALISPGTPNIQPEGAQVGPSAAAMEAVGYNGHEHFGVGVVRACSSDSADLQHPQTHKRTYYPPPRVQTIRARQNLDRANNTGKLSVLSQVASSMSGLV